MSPLIEGETKIVTLCAVVFRICYLTFLAIKKRFFVCQINYTKVETHFIHAVEERFVPGTSGFVPVFSQ